MTPEEFSKVQQISKLLNEAYDHYFEYEGHCKSSEGHITIDYGNLWERGESENFGVRGIEIYSYVFCREGRSQYFDSLDGALETVRGWHAEEISYDYNSPEALENQRLMDEQAAEFLQEMVNSGRLTIHEIDPEDEDEEYGFPV
jgi:hypothetical protein